MTARLVAELVCDGDGCGRALYADGDDLAALILSAARDGWTVGDRDLCTACVTDGENRAAFGDHAWRRDHADPLDALVGPL